MKRTLPMLVLAAALSVAVVASASVQESKQTPSVADLKKEAELQKQAAKAKEDWAKAEEKVKKLEDELRKAKDDAAKKRVRSDEAQRERDAFRPGR